MAAPDDGLAARFIYLWPVPVAVEDLAPDTDIASLERRQKLVSVAQKLVALDMPADKISGAPAPTVLRLAGDAFMLFQQQRRAAIEKARASRDIAAGWHGKTPARILRLALVYELLARAAGDRGEPRAVSADAIKRAGLFLDYAGKMFDRVVAGLSIEQAEADAAVIARGILTVRDPALTLNERTLYQRAAWLRDRVRRNDAFSLLAEAGWIRKPPSDPALFGANGSGGRPRGDWTINPKVFVK
jgi:uncharacterized protein DUF3987